MVRVATCNVEFREVSGFADFADHLREVLDQARGADLVVLPEAVTFELMTAAPSWSGATDMAPVLATAGYADDFRELMAQEAAARGQYLLAGSHLVPTGEGGYRNVAVLHDPTGAVVHEHAKTHLFPLEHTLDIVEGDEMAVVDLPFGKVGIVICYESQIPECASSLVEQGAQILLCPSLTLTRAGFWRVRHSLAARAIENQVYTVHSGVAGPARGVWPGAYATSAILGPCDAPLPDDGVIAETPADVDGVAVADLDLALLATLRESGATTTYQDRRRRVERYRAWPSHLHA
ncbi:nitrilase-related carbon-nitrogen hydrolase [Nocardioides sp. L-11A]|uniref:nitrilase-related carbon-nitrogen hydrolase n=1 Tax=Nocardioides sp. L-11A TaxID=3043848 RepID=UPI00249BC373|nr:nitrilase-related carbon-nitrogen hydrolase [Nocardioides sp. L-11A]